MGRFVWDGEHVGGLENHADRRRPIPRKIIAGLRSPTDDGRRMTDDRGQQPAARREWQAHICGVCLGLKEQFG
jgi:hypothetical protein